ncbi:LPXTG cell wall anchor domain-containing protein [Nocardiopsis sp. CNT312]|uniref:LPXTG cell wall anchor domain-containing protein n=1 Tax=Nocardiopsis sp. CNT312 TaxID=1137268 RepID=UPI0004AF15F3|nr:LPXTG cell wall anchor domain-containing protein [Nocardiopsis sp. CNT312]
MKHTARRIVQGGATFAALGALGIATAMPAGAEPYGWAYASANGADHWAETHITASESVSTPFSGGLGGWLTYSGTATAVVDSEGAHGTTELEGSITLTRGDVEPFFEDGEPGTEPSGEPSEVPSEVPSGDPTEEASEASAEEATEPGAPVETPSEAPPEEASEPEAEEAAPEEPAGTELDETSSETVDGGSEILIQEDFSAEVSVDQTWDLEVTHGATPGGPVDLGSFSGEIKGQETEITVGLFPYGDTEETTASDYHWNDAFTELILVFVVDEEIVEYTSLATAIAGITTGSVDEGEGEGDGGTGEGDGEDQNTPEETERGEETLPKADPMTDEPLAQTGSPIGGFVAAGAAIAVGGGAAAFLARRRKADNASASSGEDHGES